MSDIGINSYYTSNPKATLTRGQVFSAPESIPKQNICSDKELSKRYDELTQDLYEKTSDNKKSNFKKFAKVFCGFIAICLGMLGISKLIHR